MIPVMRVEAQIGSPLGSLVLQNPAIVTIPLGFLGCWLDTMLCSERANTRGYEELSVRSEMGLGAEIAERARGRAATGESTERALEPVA